MRLALLSLTTALSFSRSVLAQDENRYVQTNFVANKASYKPTVKHLAGG
jgi:hypothetical protein